MRSIVHPEAPSRRRAGLLAAALPLAAALSLAGCGGEEEKPPVIDVSTKGSPGSMPASAKTKMPITRK